MAAGEAGALADVAEHVIAIALDAFAALAGRGEGWVGSGAHAARYDSSAGKQSEQGQPSTWKWPSLWTTTSQLSSLRMVSVPV
jgi:hypothetical protein